MTFVALHTLANWASPSRGNKHASLPEMWRALYYFNFYRLVLAGVLITLAFTSLQDSQYGDRSPLIFTIAAVGFGVVGVINLITINYSVPRFSVQAVSQIGADMILISMLIYASDGTSSGVGLLMMISIAGAGVVLSGRATMFFAALASLLILGQVSFDVLMGYVENPNYLQIGLLGAGIFMSGFMVSILASRIRETEEAAATARHALQQQQRINEHVVHNLISGVIVVDEHDSILLTNPESERLLGIKAITAAKANAKISGHLRELVDAWRDDPVADSKPIKIGPTATSVIPRVVPVRETDQSMLMVFMDDQQRIYEQNQQNKLAALGRLTAAIAHEIRNPLSALNHAGQLLAESEHISIADKRLLDIISGQTDRINTIIESVLQLGRKQSPATQEIVLSTWLDSVIDDVLMQHQLSPTAIVCECEDYRIRGNSEQFTQVVVNLVNNALNHSPPFDGKPLIKIEVHADIGDEWIFLDVRDYGAGIDDDTAVHLFEPFFTTDSRGTGLGLYISRELCAANGARLDYISDDQPGSCFRMSFINPHARYQAAS